MNRLVHDLAEHDYHEQVYQLEFRKLTSLFEYEDETYKWCVSRQDSSLFLA